jgi:hypothetical protein
MKALSNNGVPVRRFWITNCPSQKHSSNNFMKTILASIALLGGLSVHSMGAIQVYQNTFDNTASLDDFTIYGETFVGYNPPPLHDVSVESGQLHIQTSYTEPNGPGTNPTLSGQATLMQDSSSFGGGYNTVISQSAGLVSWAFNVANQDGVFNNGFAFVLLSTSENPYDIGTHGYCFRGGSMVGNRMGLWRLDFGLGGGQTPIIDIENGLGPLPDIGSFKITYDPFTDEWKLFGEIRNEYVDPESVNSLLGAGRDGTYTDLQTPFMGVGGSNTGLDIFDNVTVSVVPEPAVSSLLLLGLVVLTVSYRRQVIRTNQMQRTRR